MKSTVKRNGRWGDSMKKLFVMLLVLTLVLGTAAGCRSSGMGTASQPAATTGTVETEYSFIDIRWTRTTEADTEFLHFSQEGQFSYSCACGNPVNDADLCEGYSYDPRTKTVTLHYPEKTDETITALLVKSCTEDTLVLDFDGDVRTFEIEGKTTDPQVGAITDTGEFEPLTFETIQIKGERVTIDGLAYELLQYKPEIFCYDLEKGGKFEEDGFYLLAHPKWDVLYHEGDLFVDADAHADACAYYAADENYRWEIAIDDAQMEDVTVYPLAVTGEEIGFMGKMEDQLGEETLAFDDIQKFATLSKISTDGLIRATVQLAYRDGVWYWRSERIDEKQEHWPEYVHKLPETLNQKILAADK